MFLSAGYGHIVPASFWGRFFCIFYALFGIPLTGLTLRSVGNSISEEIRIAVKNFERRVYNREAEKLEIKTAIIAFILLIAIVVFPAIGFHRLEEWTYFEAIYFCFVTLTTIGFGDFVTGNVKKEYSDDDAIPIVLEFLNLIYMVVGLALCLVFLFDRDIILCRDQDGGNSTDTNLFSCGLSCSYLTKTLNKARDLMEKEEPTEMDVVSSNSIFEQLTRKKSILQEIDEKNAALLEEPKDLE